MTFFRYQFYSFPLNSCWKKEFQFCFILSLFTVLVMEFYGCLVVVETVSRLVHISTVHLCNSLYHNYCLSFTFRCSNAVDVQV